MLTVSSAASPACTPQPLRRHEVWAGKRSNLLCIGARPVSAVYGTERLGEPGPMRAPRRVKPFVRAISSAARLKSESGW